MMREDKLMIRDRAQSPAAEAFRGLRTYIQLSQDDGDMKTILFTSTGSDEGKSLTVANTAISIAQSGKKVIILDCDLRKPVQHTIFGVQNVGITDILLGTMSIEDAIQKTDIPNLYLVASGSHSKNPAELLAATRLYKIFETLKNEATVILIDTPPILAVTDALILAGRVDGVALIMDSGSVRPDDAQKAKNRLIKAKANILGVIMNRVDDADEEVYSSYYYRTAQQKAR
ncbi:MAG: capsular exopolysaccharide family [Firmicutes bacterium]|nr:capsular exopolysaccharide family [Bacillota bacterium]